jgi:LIM domain kinase 1
MVNGEEFDLPTDVYTLGLVFIELLSRKLVARWLFTVSITLNWGSVVADNSSTRTIS